MKTLCFTTMNAALLLFILGCTQNKSDQLTQQQKEQIKNEVMPVIDSVTVRWMRSDVDGCLDLYSPDFVSAGDTLRYDLEGYKKMWNEYDQYLSVVKMTTLRSELIVCTKDIVISTWAGKEEHILKSGEIIIYAPRFYALVLKKYAGQWKVIFSTGSGNPVVQPAEKK
jgi:hypothetical protein